MRINTAFLRIFSLGLLVVVLALLPADIRAQQIDHRGREFWITFMPNMGSRANEISRLRLYLTSAVPAQATITYTATGQSEQIAIPVANVPVEVNLGEKFGESIELQDFTVGNSITQKSFIVAADNDISVSGVNIRSKSADAFLALPVDALRNHYYVLAYPNGYSNITETFDMPSGFAVIATESDTRLDVTPPKGLRINGRPEETFTITLNRGEVFLGQAALNAENDVSGTRIVASHPVAVFAGTKRVSIPISRGNFRDHMVEQIVPDEFWKTSFVAVPKVPQENNNADSTQYKIVARDNSHITIRSNNRQDDFPISSGTVVTISSRDPVHINSTAPILVAQYDPSQDLLQTGQELGDPSMAIIPAIEQWDTAYTFTSIIDPEFTRHYIDVIVPHAEAGTLLLDGMPMNAVRTPLDDTFDHVQFAVSGGGHHISASVPIGVMVYGVGESVSYAYPAGMVFSRPASAPAGPHGNDNNSLRLLAMPNPVTGNSLKLEVHSAQAAHARIDVIDERGNVVIPATADLYCAEGNNMFTLDISGLASAPYFCRVFLDDAGASIVKFVVQR